ncbi:unnamed protein product [Brassicogethes aeneus]|uniref:Protein deadpan n=1 Tax=Brassicogethes aeneus TaxID=1431903 RepID=A0A9P0B0N4_BRAAE|nr:unnamed protein product [Brassicogethes aeneus]
MPISDDEYEYSRNMQEPQTTMSKAELRKTHKPIMEKRRRARINHCLNDIKSLILEAMNKDPARHSKLEKADILEMAVKHLQNTQRQQLAMAMATDPSVLRKFKSGFNECSKEIDKYISTLDGVDSAMKQRISAHLQKCIGGIEQVAQFNFPGFNNLPFLSNASNIFSQQKLNESINVGDQNNNPRIQIPQGIQLIPSRLPSGELALLLPNSSNLPYFPQVNQQQNNFQNRNSAFAAVVPHSETTSKPLSPPMSPIQIHEDLPRYQSPQGFRPVQKQYHEDHQVPQISSTITIADKHTFIQPEVKTMKFPILKTFEKPRENPKKIAEPLCIITNHNERYKQAQTKEDSAHYEENHPQYGVKRKHSETVSNLLTFADFPTQPTKVLKMSPSFRRERECSSSSYQRVVPEEDRNAPADNGDMWRPW